MIAKRSRALTHGQGKDGRRSSDEMTRGIREIETEAVRLAPISSCVGLALVVTLACATTIGAGAPRADSRSWDKPWVYTREGVTTSAVPALHSLPVRQVPRRSLPIRLDDGTLGTARIKWHPCPIDDGNAPPCEKWETYWIVVTDSHNRTVSTVEFYAAYGAFDVVPVDLVDGPGDELVVVRIPAHSSPPIGYDLMIWQIEKKRPIALLTEPVQLAGLIGTDGISAISCGSWKIPVVVDTAEAKPRSLTLKAEFTVGRDVHGQPPCRIQSDPSFAALSRGHALRFLNGKYRLRR
jgi:hypothetical protein